jgi:hypothetical protein
MPAYNFQRQFIAPILRGDKPHTIRHRRMHPVKPGDTIMMFTGLRTKHCTRFGTAPCVKVEPIIIYPWKMEVLIADHQGVFGWMREDEINALARRDGFTGASAFFAFFKQYGLEMLSAFEIIWWDPKMVEIVPGVRMVKALEVKHG